jgi:hypothetical protein
MRLARAPARAPHQSGRTRGARRRARCAATTSDGRKTIAVFPSDGDSRAPRAFARRRARCAATTSDGRKTIAVFPSDGDSRAGTDALAHATTMAACVNARVGARCEAVVVARGDDGAWADCALATTGDARAGRARAAARATSRDFDDGDGDEGAAGFDFYVTTLSTTRSRKRPCVALDVESTTRYPRLVAAAIRARAEAAFADAAGSRDFDVRGGRLVSCAASDEGAVAYDGVEEDEDEDDDDEDEDEDEAATSTSAPATSFVRVELSDSPVSGTARAWSKMFVHAAAVGLSMESVIEHLVKNATSREASTRKIVAAPAPASASTSSASMRVYVLFGGAASGGDRLSSCYAGRNLYLTLRNIPTIDVTPVLLMPPAANSNGLVDAPAWRLPYAFAVNPAQWSSADVPPRMPDLGRFATARRVRAELEKYLWISPPRDDAALAFDATPRVSRLGALLSLAASEGAIVFNAGVVGEPDGSLQQLCVSSGAAYTGCGPLASRVCADKAATSKALGNMRDVGVGCLNKRFVPTATLVSKATEESGWGGRARAESAKRLWLDVVGSLGGASATARGVIVKPVTKSSFGGVRRLMNDNDMLAYAESIAAAMASGQFPEGTNLAARGYVFEPFFDAAEVSIRGDGEIVLDPDDGSKRWIEIEIVVFGDKPGKLHAFTPSVRARDGRSAIDKSKLVLSERVVGLVRERARRVGDALQVEGYAKVNAFANLDNGEMIVIDVDTVPNMSSPSAPLFEQALAEDSPVDAETFCARALSLALVRRFR